MCAKLFLEESFMCTRCVCVRVCVYVCVCVRLMTCVGSIEQNGSGQNGTDKMV